MSEQVVEVRYVAVEPKRKTNHILHLLLSLITLGVWLPIWFLISMTAVARNRVGESKPSHAKNFAILAVLIVVALVFGGRP